MLTKLEALNIILSSSQLSPVESLDSGDIDAEIAESILQEVLEEVQTRGWAWNTEEMRILPDTSGNLNLPANVLSVDPVDPRKRVVQRGQRLYNLEENSFTFNQPIDVRLTLALVFEDLPQSVRRYISIKSSRLFQQRTLGDGNVHQFISMEETSAWNTLIMDDVRAKDVNMITGGPVSARMKHRIKPRRR